MPSTVQQMGALGCSREKFLFGYYAYDEISIFLDEKFITGPLAGGQAEYLTAVILTVIKKILIFNMFDILEGLNVNLQLKM